MKKERNFCLDFFRGLAALSVVVIHTAYWSGMSYVPDFVRNIVLMLDVPFFFFLAGWSFSYSNSVEKAFRGLVQIQIEYFFFLVLYTFLLFVFNRNEVTPLNFIYNFYYINTIESRVLPVVMGSIWFMPVYFIVVSVFSGILNYFYRNDQKFAKLMVLVICFLSVLYYSINPANYWVLSACFYGFFYSLGYFSHNHSINSKRLLAIILSSLIVLIIIVKWSLRIDNIIVQNYKFPPHILYLLLSLFSICIALYLKNKLKIKANNKIAHIGNHALFYYFGQGISSSIIYHLINILDYHWFLEFFIAIGANIIMAIFISEFLAKIIKTLIDYIRKWDKKLWAFK